MGKTVSKSEHWIIKNAEGNMRLEGFSTSSEVKKDCGEMIEGRVSSDKMVGRYVDKHSKRKSL